MLWAHLTLKEWFRHPVKCHRSLPKTQWLAVLRVFCNSVMVKALTRKRSDRSNLSRPPGMYKVVRGKWSPTSLFMNLGQWSEINCVTIRQRKIHNAGKNRQGGKNVVAWSWLGILCFSSWSLVSYLSMNDTIKMQMLGNGFQTLRFAFRGKYLLTEL